MDDQPVLERIDSRRPRMMTLVVKPARSDDSGKILEWGQAERRHARRRFRQALSITAHDAAFKPGGPPIGRADDLRAGLELPLGNRGRQVVALMRKRRACRERRGRGACASLDQTAAGDGPRRLGGLGLGPVARGV